MNKILAECFYFTKSNFGEIFRIFGPYMIFTSLLTPSIELFLESVNYSQVNFINWILIFTVQTYLMVRFIKFMAFKASIYKKDETVSWREFLRLFLVQLLYCLAIILGTFVLIIPGLYIASKYALADFDVILNDKPIFLSLSESWKNTEGIVGRLMLIFVLSCGLDIIISFTIEPPEDASTLQYFITETLRGLISYSLMIFTYIIYFRVYIEKRLGSGTLKLNTISG